MSARPTRSRALTPVGAESVSVVNGLPSTTGNEQKSSVDVDAATKLLYLSVATGRAFPHVAQWMRDKSGEMQAMAETLQHECSGPMLNTLRNLHKDVTDSRAASEAKRNKVLKRMYMMQSVRRHQLTAGVEWLAAFQEAARTYLSALQEMREELLHRKELAALWTLHGKRDAMMANLMQINKKHAMLCQRREKGIAKETTRRVQTLHNMRGAMGRLVGEVGDAVTWELQQRLHGYPMTCRGGRGGAASQTDTVLSTAPADERQLLAEERELRMQLRQMKQQGLNGRRQGRRKQPPHGAGTMEAKPEKTDAETSLRTKQLLPSPPTEPPGRERAPEATRAAAAQEENISTTPKRQQQQQQQRQRRKEEEQEEGEGEAKEATLEEGRNEKGERKLEHRGGVSSAISSGGDAVKLPPLEQRQRETQLSVSKRKGISGQGATTATTATATTTTTAIGSSGSGSGGGGGGGGGGTLPSMYRRGSTAVRPPIVLPPTNLSRDANGRHNADHLASLLAVLTEDTAHLSSSWDHTQKEVWRLQEELRGHEEETARLLRSNIDLEAQRAQLIVQRDAQKLKLQHSMMTKKTHEDLRGVDVLLLNAELTRTLEMLQGQLEKRRAEIEEVQGSIADFKRMIAEQDKLMERICEYWHRNVTPPCWELGEGNRFNMQPSTDFMEITPDCTNSFTHGPPVLKGTMQPTRPSMLRSCGEGTAVDRRSSCQSIPALGLQDRHAVAEFIYSVFEELVVKRDSRVQVKNSWQE